MINKKENQKNYKNYQSLLKTIKIDIDKIKNSLIYQNNIFGKNPKELLLKGKELYDDNHIYLKKFPVEKVIFDLERVNITGFLYSFDNTKILEASNNTKFIQIYNKLILKNLNEIIIPFDIKSFKIVRLNNKINTINIKYNDEILNIVLPNNTLNKKGMLEIKKDNDNNLIILVNFNTKIEYKVFIKDNKLEFERKYIKYEITNNYSTLDLIKLKKIYNEIIFNEPLDIKKIVITKKELPLIYQIPFDGRELKEINIKDDNDMSLFPKDKKIRFSGNAWIKDKELLNNNKILLRIYNSHFKEDSIMLINDDLSSIKICNFWWQDTSKYRIEELIFSYDHTKFIKEEIDSDRIRLIIPIENSAININEIEILKKIVNYSERIKVLKNNEEVLINDKNVLSVKLNNIVFMGKNRFYVTNEEKLIYSRYYSTNKYMYNEKTNNFDKYLLDWGTIYKENVYSNLLNYNSINEEENKRLIKKLVKNK